VTEKENRVRDRQREKERDGDSERHTHNKVTGRYKEIKEGKRQRVKHMEEKKRGIENGREIERERERERES
jgi:hypothetical protein